MFMEVRGGKDREGGREGGREGVLWSQTHMGLDAVLSVV